MDAAGREEEDVSRAYVIVPQNIRDRVVLDFFLVFLRSDLLCQARKELCSLVGSYDIPHLGLAFLAGIGHGGKLVGGVDLYRQVILGINEFD